MSWFEAVLAGFVLLTAGAAIFAQKHAETACRRVAALERRVRKLEEGRR